MTSTTPRRVLGLRTNLLRPADAERSDKVTFIELFFDLIFVFALTQLSRFIAENQTLVGALESMVLVLALWWVWIYTTWVTNWLDPVRLPVRGAVIGLALIGLVMSTSIFESFGDRGLVFAIAYVALQLGRTAFMLVAVAHHDHGLRQDFTRILIWLSAAGVLWIVGALVPLEFRLSIWIAAILVEYLSAAVGFRVPGMSSARVGDWEVSGPHIAERSALFVIIAIGESFLVTGFSFVSQDVSLLGVIGVMLAFLSGVAMWWLYFDHGEHAGAEAIKHAKDPGRLARLAYTYVHAIVIGGIVLTSVADEMILGHPDSHMEVGTVVAIVGGPVLYLAGLALFRVVVARDLLISHLVGIGALLATLFFAASVTPIVLGSITTAILVATAAWETIVRVRTGTAEESAG